MQAYTILVRVAYAQRPSINASAGLMSTFWSELYTPAAKTVVSLHTDVHKPCDKNLSIKCNMFN